MHICIMPDFKPGDPAPEGYLEWHEWAEVQHKAGLRQKRCGKCMLWRYPQEMSDVVQRGNLKDSKGNAFIHNTNICLKCLEPNK